MTKDSKPALAARRAFLAKLGGAAVGAARPGRHTECLGEN